MQSSPAVGKGGSVRPGDSIGVFDVASVGAYLKYR